MTGLAHNQVTIWWITLGLGVVVLLVVVLLLSLLVGIVRDIARNVDGALSVAGQVAGNTGNIALLGNTQGLSAALRDEVHTHAELFASLDGAR